MVAQQDTITDDTCMEKNLYTLQQRTKHLYDLLQQTPIAFCQLRHFVIKFGVPEVPKLRALLWKSLLYRPDNQSLSNMLQDGNSSDISNLYWNLVGHYEQRPNQQAIETDHPLNTDDNSCWKQYFINQQLLKRIRLDTMRTYPELHPFRQWEEAMTRMLFVYAKQHATMGYIQGMNEVLAPFVYVFFTADRCHEHQTEAIAYVCYDCFFSSFLAPLYVKGHDMLHRRMNQVAQWLLFLDPSLYSHLQNENVDLHFFLRRWLQLCLCREFDFPELLKIWDILFMLQEEKRWKWFILFIVSMLVYGREKLMGCSFEGCIQVLQHYATSCCINEEHVVHLLNQTQQWMEQYDDESTMR